CIISGQDEGLLKLFSIWKCDTGRNFHTKFWLMDPYLFQSPDRKHNLLCLLGIFPMDIRIGRSRHFLPSGFVQYFTAIFFCISYIYTASYSLDIGKGLYFLLLLLIS